MGVNDSLVTMYHVSPFLSEISVSNLNRASNAEQLEQLERFVKMNGLLKVHAACNLS